jgi:predicted amidohydrolase YtcJ
MRLARFACAFGCLLSSMPTLAVTPTADRIWHGGPILTMNDSAMRAEAVAEAGGRIIAVGKEADVLAKRGQGTQVIDLGGRALVPGFVDAHGHIFVGGLQAITANLLAPPDGPVTDIAALQRVMKDWLRANPDAARQTTFAIGFGYDNTQLAERRHPNRDELDAVSTEVPIVAFHQSGHLGVANTRALEILGYGRDTPDPPGGVIRRRAGGTDPDGVLEETALFPIVNRVFAAMGPAGMKRLLKAGAEEWARYGYTTVQEGRALPPVVDAMRAVAAEGGFKVDVVAYIDIVAGRDAIAPQVSRKYVNRFRVGGAKLVIDGSPQAFTAWRDRPYYAPVGSYPPGYHGYPSATDAQVIDAIDWSFANGIQIMTHANGEAANDLLLAAIEVATAKHGPADRRPLLIHGQFVREDQLDACRGLGVMPSFFAMHTFYWGDWHRDHTVGPERADDISPTGWAVQRGMKFTSHHDAPVVLPDAMRVLDATVTRRSRSGDIIGPAQRVDAMTGLKALTIWAAYQYFEEGQKGSLEVGKLADLVVLSADPTAVDAETIDQIKVVETIKQGQTIYVATR